MMATRPYRRRPAYPRRRPLLAAVTTAFATISLAFIPTATARSNREKASPSTPQTVVSDGSPQQTGVSDKPGPKPAKQETPAETIAAPSPARHSKRAGPSTPTAGEAIIPVTHTAGPSTPSRSHKPEKAAGEGSQAQAPTGNGRTGKTEARAEPGTAKKAVAPGQIEERRSRESTGKATSPRVTRAMAKQVEAARPSVSSGSGSGSTGTVSTAAAAPPPTATTAAALPPAASVVATPPAAASQPPASAPATAPARHATHARRGGARNRARGSRSAGTAALPLAALLAGTAPANVANQTIPARRATKTGHGGTAAGIVAPIATTITKFVNVVPTPVRALIGALLALALVLGVRSRLAARRARRLEQQRGQLLEDVGLLQAALLPVAPARLGPVGTTAAYRPAAGPAAGGDFYDVFALEDGQLAVIVGDVSGHGRKALPHTALVRFTLRAYLEAGMSPRGAVQTAGSVLARQLGSSFVTVVAATYNPRTRMLVYASAGHPPPVVIGADNVALTPVTVSSSPPIGVGMATGTRQSIVAVPGRAQICFHTDGVTEARVGSQLFGSERLTSALVKLGPEGSAAELLDRVSEEADSRPDDMAACLLSVDGDTQAPRTLREELELDRETAASARTERFLLSCGLPASEVPATLHIAAAAAARSGSVVLEVNRENGRVQASLQPDNLTYLQTRHASRQAELTVSR
jgi:serine phosphatase RsbU (regulator of sigma subunit)